MAFNQVSISIFSIIFFIIIFLVILFIFTAMFDVTVQIPHQNMTKTCYYNISQYKYICWYFSRPCVTVLKVQEEWQGVHLLSSLQNLRLSELSSIPNSEDRIVICIC